MWTVEYDATIVSMIAGGSYYAKIALAMGKGLRGKDINIMWNRHLLKHMTNSKGLNFASSLIQLERHVAALR